MKMISGIYWEKGRRLYNQDSVTLQQVMTGRGRVLLVAVSDGIGGLDCGEIASGYILERIVHTFYQQLLPLIYKRKGKIPLKKCMIRCFYGINQDLNRYARDREIRLGATISLLLIWKRRYMLFHLGDSRIYLCKRQKIKQLTKDHGSGKGLAKCLGSFGFQYPDMRFGHIIGECGLLLCTDGFYKKMDKKMAAEVLCPGDIKEELQISRRIRTLGESVLEAGEQDNCSAVYVKVW